MKFTPVIRTANSIPRALLEFSKDRKIDIKMLDYMLLSFETLIKRPKEDEYQIINDFDDITTQDIKDSSTTIIQEYEIQIIPLASKSPPIKLSIAANKLKTKAVITIKEGSVFVNKTSLPKTLKQHIWDKKLRAGLLIGLFEQNLDKQLKKLLQMVPKDKKIEKEIKFTVAAGVVQTPPIDAHIEKIYEKKALESSSIISGVEIGELIFKYIKPKAGKNGRSCNGKFLLTRDPLTKDKRPVINETIREEMGEDAIEYYANDTGYVVCKDGEYFISKQLKLEGANFKSTANINAGEQDTDISVHIGHSKSHSEDAIGSGVNIDVKELNVDGSIAANVQISTEELNIDAQTHRNSKMNVKNTANIKLHRGDLVATEANIDVLESGKVTAHEKIYIKQMLGGTAIAPIVVIDELISNSTIIASQKIEIKTILGWDNKLIIDPNSIEAYHVKIQNIKEQIAKENKYITLETTNLENKFKEHASQIDRIKTVQLRIVQAKKMGKKPVKQDMVRLHLYKKESESLKIKKAEVDEKTSKIEALNNELSTLYNQDLHAKVILKSSYDGNTQVIFIDPQTQEKIKQSPEGTYEEISLILNGEGEKVIYNK
ncbi:hypothetical protein JHD48_00420 [Sulfurimonas sp. SAG-AH-194-I05]|nr:flagellar assembly protein A [Sulfurimonas sp. SAG-AH-194-I05]MDF1874190.1 hypothetical protein [Sulfurimonas sp. SAG-AH-194-I05]